MLNATGPARRCPRESVVAMFERRAAREPRRIALRQGGTERHLRRAARAEPTRSPRPCVAHGVEPGDRVAIAGRRSIARRHRHPRRRSRRGPPTCRSIPRSRRHGSTTCSRTPAPACCSSARACRLAPTRPGLAVLRVDDGASCARRVAAAGRIQVRTSTDLAYLMYTSGLDGAPEGRPHRSRRPRRLSVLGRATLRPRRPPHAMPLFTSLAFDLTVTSLFLPLITGGTLEIYPEPDGPVDSAVMDVAAANAVDFIKLTPSHLSLLRRIGLEGSRIRRMVVGGEDLEDIARRPRSTRSCTAQVEIHNEYGPTEAVVGCVAHRYDPQRGHGRQRADRRSSGPRPRRDPQRRAGRRCPRACQASSGCRASGSRAAITGCRTLTGRTFHAGSAAARRAPLPHRGPRADGGPGDARVSRPHRSPGEGLGLSASSRARSRPRCSRCRRSSSAP